MKNRPPYLYALALALLSAAAVGACAGRNGLTDSASDLVTAGSTGTTGAGTTTGEPGGTTDLTYYRDIKPIVDARCGTCHAPGQIGPFTLNNFNDVQAHTAGMMSQIGNDIMPPWQPDDVCNQYLGSIAMTADEKASVMGWLNGGAPEGDPNDIPNPGPTADSYPALRADRSLKMAAPYKIRTSPDEYRCFILKWPDTAVKYVQGFAIKPGNPAVVHHAIVDIVAPADAAKTMALDGKDGQPGWACGQQGASLNWLGAWAPGGRAGPFAADGSLGTRIDPGTLLVLQMHYHTENVSTAAPDQSGVDLQVADSVPKVGHMVPMISYAWAGPSVIGFPGVCSMKIPAGNADVVQTYSTDAQGLIGAGNAIYSVGVHAHVRASQGNLTLQRSGQSQCLVNIPHFNFHWQNGYLLQKPQAVAAGDKVVLTCHFDNSAANQPLVNGVKDTPHDVCWGEGTNDEMCLGVLYVAPP